MLPRKESKWLGQRLRWQRPNYEKSIERQAKTAAALAQVEQKLKKLQSTGQTLEQIKSILRDAISILVDLSVQIGKIEDFFTMLQTIIDHIIMPKVKDFEQDLSKAGDRAYKNKILKARPVGTADHLHDNSTAERLFLHASGHCGNVY